MRRLAIILATLTTLLPMPARAFSVSPAIIDLSAARGTTATATVTVANDEAREKSYYLQAVKFEPREDSDAPRFVPYEADHAGLPEWMVFEKKVRVPASGVLKVPVKVAVPADALSGAHYAAITVSDAPYDVASTRGAPVQARVAVLVFLTVEGGSAKLALMDFLPDAQKAVRTDAAVAFRARLQNQGDEVVVPTGSVELRDALGRLIAESPVNAEGSRVVHGRTRAFEGTLEPRAFAVGPVTALLRLSYAPDAAPITSSFSFFLLPVPVSVALGAAGLVLALAAAVILTRALRRRA